MGAAGFPTSAWAFVCGKAADPKVRPSRTPCNLTAGIDSDRVVGVEQTLSMHDVPKASESPARGPVPPDSAENPQELSRICHRGLTGNAGMHNTRIALRPASLHCSWAPGVPVFLCLTPWWR